MDFIDLKTQYAGLKDGIDRRIQTVLDHGKFIMGPEIGELEEQLTGYVGAKHAITVSSGTDALQVAMMALGVRPGDEVVTTPFTFISTAETIALLGAKPVFVDIDPATYNIDPAAIEAAVTGKTRAIMPVSLYGQCAAMDTINEIAARHGLPVIEDAAQSFGATYNGKKSCGLTTIGCASFFPAKPLGCYGDGGACFTDDDALAARMRQIRVHGQDRRYNHPLIGLNARMDTLQAAILIEKLAAFPDEVEARTRIGAQYTQRLEDIVITPAIAPECIHVYAQYTVQVDDREAVRSAMNEKGIPTAVHYPIPLHRQPALSYLGLGEGSFPMAEKMSARVLSLPMHPYLKDDQIERVAGALREVISGRETALK